MNNYDAIVLLTYGTNSREKYEICLEPFLFQARIIFGQNTKISFAFRSKERSLELEKSGIKIATLEEEVEYLKERGYGRILVKPIYIVEGREYKKVKEVISKYEDISLDKPLLYKDSSGNFKNIIELVNILKNMIEADEALILVGHGSLGKSNLAYKVIGEYSRKEGYNIFIQNFIGGEPLEKLINDLKNLGIEKIILLPFLIIWGYHYDKDIVGEERGIIEILRKEGFSVSLYKKPLGGIKEIREMFFYKHENGTEKK